MIDMLNKVTGAHFEPIKPVYVLNEDYSSQYYCSGVVNSDVEIINFERTIIERSNCYHPVNDSCLIFKHWRC